MPWERVTLYCGDTDYRLIWLDTLKAKSPLAHSRNVHLFMSHPATERARYLVVQIDAG